DGARRPHPRVAVSPAEERPGRSDGIVGRAKNIACHGGLEHPRIPESDRRTQFQRTTEEPPISRVDSAGFRPGRTCGGAQALDYSVRSLAIRFARFGDIVLLLPALNLLKARLPDSNLTFLTDSRWRDLAAMCPAIHQVFSSQR